MRPISLLACVSAMILTNSAQAASPTPGPLPLPSVVGNQHDFDFEFGAWRVNIHRLINPLSGGAKWIDLNGTSVVRKVWDGRANLGELEVAGGGVTIEGLSLRVFDPAVRQWRIHWANATDGLVGDAMRGGFTDGRGEFFDKEMYNEREVLVRFVFSDLTPKSFHFEQAFSTNDGVTWEVNWIANFSRADRRQ